MGQPGRTGRGIRAQLNRMVLVPGLTFLALFAVMGAAVLGQVVSLRTAVGDGRDGLELVEALARLQTERRLVAGYLAAPSGGNRGLLADAVEETDLALDRVRSLDGDPEGLAGDFLDTLEGVERAREDGLGGGAAPAIVEAYTEALHSGIRLYGSVTRRLDSGPAATDAAAATGLLWALESFSHADALVSGSMGTTLPPSERARIAALLADTRHRVETDVPPSSEAASGPAGAAPVAESPAWQEAMDLADRLASQEAGPAVTGGWRSAADRVSADLEEAVAERTASAVSAGESFGAWRLPLVVGSGLVALLAGALAYGVATRAATRLTDRLAKLRSDILGAARNDLPRIVRRLEAGDGVDLDTDVRRLDHGDDEIGRVADAFDLAQRAAVGAAVRQADLRAGANRVFLGIAHRSQALVQRQIQLLDRVEREEEDPDLLESLFQLDHLATRGRRHAENLIILGGAQPGRRWRHPVSLMDLLRGAVSETEEYARVRLTSVPELSLSGAVVADVIHMLAELVENATAHSPPHTEVTVATETVPKGVVVEVEDQGPGMTDEVLARANATLSAAPEFDVMGPATDARLGLFVVARLAHKHGIGVELRPAPHGGIRAVVLIPSGLLAAPPAAAPDRIGGPARASAYAGYGPDIPGASGGRRPVLRPVPRHQGAEEAAPPGSAGPPVLRQVPDLAEEAAPPVRGAGHRRPPLPKRRRQASLVPRLKEEREGPEQSTDRSPEEARRMMDAFSAGTRRGRSEDTGTRGYADRTDANADDHMGEND
ncbi:nitrate- and nitrite sensing domain-containing protein [Nocardiopsis sp. CNT312]|uniref:sensor histidine kinase n=1 Tax=Nocardiopsis sp. CNT312 TaxID=1137268 RepID=UPI00048B5DDA|nr:nitrate- and nitrite sensing domain-containing protein [Nocardiopsis sp. CNT312]